MCGDIKDEEIYIAPNFAPKLDYAELIKKVGDERGREMICTAGEKEILLFLDCDKGHGVREYLKKMETGAIVSKMLSNALEDSLNTHTQRYMSEPKRLIETILSGVDKIFDEVELGKKADELFRRVQTGIKYPEFEKEKKTEDRKKFGELLLTYEDLRDEARKVSNDVILKKKDNEEGKIQMGNACITDKEKICNPMYQKKAQVLHDRITTLMQEIDECIKKIRDTYGKYEVSAEQTTLKVRYIDDLQRRIVTFKGEINSTKEFLKSNSLTYRDDVAMRGS